MSIEAPPVLGFWGFDQLNGWATGAAADIAQNVFSSLVGWVVGSMSYVMGLSLSFALSNDSIAQGCTIDGVAACSRQAFVFATFSRSRAVAGVMLVMFLLWGLGRAALTGDGGAVMRKFFLEMPKAVLLSTLILQIVIVMLLITDAISNELIDPVFQADRDEYFAGFQQFDDMDAGEGAMASFAMLMLGVLVLLGSVFLWLLMMLRSVAIAVLVTLAPIVAVLGVTSYAASMQKLMRLLLALIASKIIIVLTLSLGVSIVMNTAVLREGLDQAAVVAAAPAAPGDVPPEIVELAELDDGAAVAAMYQMGTGAIVVLLSLFSPMLIMQMIPDSVEQYYMFGELGKQRAGMTRYAAGKANAVRDRVSRGGSTTRGRSGGGSSGGARTSLRSRASTTTQPKRRFARS